MHEIKTRLGKSGRIVIPREYRRRGSVAFLPLQHGDQASNTVTLPIVLSEVLSENPYNALVGLVRPEFDINPIGQAPIAA